MPERRWTEWADFAGRLGIVCYFTFAAVLKGMSIAGKLSNWPTAPGGNFILSVLTDLSVLVFLAVVVAITVFRLEPIKSAEGLEPRVSALAGTFLLVFLAVIVPDEPPAPLITVIGLLLVFTGSLLSAYVLTWLGRSFSIMAEARKLVTGGPYRVVRHPLYLVEEISTIGIIVLNHSWQAVLLGLVHWALQLRRMHNEEKVLRSAFPDYDAYAQRTPRIIPRLTGAIGPVRA